MRIVQFLWNMDFADGGVVRALTDLCPMLARAGHQVTLLCCRTNPTIDAWPISDGSSPRLVRIDPPRPPKVLTRHALSQCAEQIRSADVVHIHGMWVACNFQIARLCRRLKKPYILSPHGMLDDWPMSQHPLRKRMLLALAYRSVLERAAFVHCTADAEREQASKHFPRGRARVVTLPMDLAPFRNLPGPAEALRSFSISSAGIPVVLSIGRLHHKKGVHILLDAAAILHKQGHPLQLVIAGEGDADHVQLLKQKAAALPPGSVCFVGFVSGQIKLSLYQAADVVCLPTSQENFGYAVVEAMAASRPVLTTRGVALWPELERANAAALCDPTPDSVAAALAPLLADPELRRTLGASARQWCFDHLDSPAATQAFVDMYQEAASR